MKTPTGTSVGVDDPYARVDRCDYLTDDGQCRFALERPGADPSFARDRAREDYHCPAVDSDAPWEWQDCPHMRARDRSRTCARCGLAERRVAHSDERPLIEEHHLTHPDDRRLAVSHEITVSLCRWCHAAVHASWARIDDDVNPDPEALAAVEARRSREQDELDFETAAERRK